MSSRKQFNHSPFRLKQNVRGMDIMQKGLESWPRGQEDKSWIWLVGDCFFEEIYTKFENCELDISDCPYIIAAPGGKVENVMDYLTTRLKKSTKMIVIHLGANDVASRNSQPEGAAGALIEKSSDLLKKNLAEEISFCLLSPRIVDGMRFYDAEYIESFNQRVPKFNECLNRAVDRYGGFSTINFGLDREDLPTVLRGTGFGVSDSGTELLSESLRSLIKFKVNTSEDNDDSFFKLFPLGENRGNRPIVLRCHAKGHDVSFYKMARNPVRLSLSSRAYQESVLPRLAPDDEGFITKRRKGRRIPVHAREPPKKPRRD